MYIKTLREYQETAINDCLRALNGEQFKEVLFNFAVGSGKSTILTITGTEALKTNYDKVIIAAPFSTIISDIANMRGQSYKSSSSIATKYKINKDISSKVLEDTLNEETTVKGLLDSLCNSDKQFLVISHHLLSLIVDSNEHKWQETKRNKNIKWNRILIMVDEAHRCYDDYIPKEDGESDELEVDGEIVSLNKQEKRFKSITKEHNKIGQFYKETKELGVKYIRASATPYYHAKNGDIKLIVNPDAKDTTKIIDRTIGQQIIEGFSPEIKVNYVIIKKGLKLVDNNGETLNGDSSTSRLVGNKEHLKPLANEIYQQWETDKFPKLLIIIPSGESEKKAELIKKLLENHTFPNSLSKIRNRKKPVILNACGINNKDDILQQIKSDKENIGRNLDIIIACKRLDEGTDIPTASHLYMIGFPASVRSYHQRSGRILRMKDSLETYNNGWFPKEYKDKSYCNFLYRKLNAKENNLDSKAAKFMAITILASENLSLFENGLKINPNSLVIIHDKINKFRLKNPNNINLEKLQDSISHLVYKTECLKDENNMDMFNHFINKDEISGYDFYQYHRSKYPKTLSEDDRKNLYADIIASTSLLDSKTRNDIGVKTNKELNKKKDVVNFKNPNIVEHWLSDIVNIIKETSIIHIDNERINSVCASITGKTYKDVFNNLGNNDYDQAVKNTHLCCDYHDKYGHFPIKDIVDKNEIFKGVSVKYLGGWRLKAKHLFYINDLKVIAMSRNYPNMFDYIDWLEKSINKTIWCCEFKNKHGVYPNMNSKNLKEKSHGSWLSMMKQRKLNNNKVSGFFYNECEQISEKYNCADLFIPRNDISRYLKNIENICDFKIKTGHYPNQNSKNINERKLGNLLCNIRNNPKIEGVCLAKKLNCCDIMLKNNSIDKQINILKHIYDFKIKNGHYPHAHSLNTDEKYMSSWLTKKRYEYKNGRIKDELLQLSIKLSIKLKCVDCLIPIDYEKTFLKNCKDVINFVKVNHRTPKSRGFILNERKLGTFLTRLKGKYKKTGRNKDVFYPSALSLFKKEKMMYLLDD